MIKTKSQNQQILGRLRKEKTLTSVEIIQEMNVLRPGSRINELRNAGHHISTEMIKLGKTRIAQYRLEEEES